MSNQEAETRPLILSTQELLNAYWPQVEPLLASAPVAKEVSTDAIFKAALAGQMLIFVFITENSDVELALVVASVPSDVLPVVNIITVAGKNLRKHTGKFWEFFKGWCYMNGARAIDAYVPERMEGFMEELGLKKETVHVRLRL